MKKWIVLSVILLVAVKWSYSQNEGLLRQNMEQRIEAQRIAFITERIQLTPAEAQSFWPIYNEYRDKEKQLKISKAPPKVLVSMSDEESKAYLEKVLEIEQEELDLKKDYMGQLKSVLSSRKILQLFAAEMKFKEELIKRINQQRNKRLGNR